MTKVVQITDLHLVSDRKQPLRDIYTWDTFEEVLADIDANHSDHALLVITGDIADDEALATYQQLREAIGDRLDRCRFVPGNHDNRDHLSSTFPAHFSAGTETLDFVTHAGSPDTWRIVGIDTQRTGAVDGHITDAQVEWLGLQLASGDMPTLVFQHHPPGPIGVAWVDKLGFEAHDGYFSLLSSHGVAAIGAGHVHQASESTVNSVPFYTTPSTCTQFGNNDEPVFLPSGWGYRVFELDETTLETDVVRVTPLPA